MALDATVGGLLADAYLTVADVDTRAARDLGTFAAAWVSDATEAAADGPNRLQKEAAIRRATEEIEELADVASDPYTIDQARIFPRSFDYDDAGPYIPAAIGTATYRQAVYLYSNADRIDHASTRRARAMTNFSEPNVSGSLAADASYGRFAPGVERILKPLTEGSVIGVIVRA